MAEQEAPLREENPLLDDIELLAKFQKWDKAIEAHWGDWVKEAKECYRYVAGHQYNKRQLEDLKENNRPHAVFNRIGPIIDSVVGAEIQARQETKYLPRTNDDSGLNELLSRAAEYIRDEGDADSEESVMYRDCFVCGVGWTECKLEYDDDPQGAAIFNRLEPWSVLADPSSTKPNFRDKRYLRWQKDYTREEFEELWPGKSGVLDDETGVDSYNSDPKYSYNGEDDTRNEDEQVTVSLYQYIEIESIVLVPDEMGEALTPMSAEDYEEARAEAEERGEVPPLGQTQKRKKYKYAFTTGREILDKGDLDQQKFTINAVTGKRDEDDGVYYGLVRAMKDPQMWANTFFNMILHIVRTNAKGGLLAEKGAVEDQRRFEATYAKSDTISWLENGALQQNRIKEKAAPAYPATIDSLLERAIEAIRETSGVNAEILGLADREQPGVLEMQRKQAAYGILAPFFESFKRYRKSVGELMMDYMRQMQGKMVRVTIGSGVDQYVPLIMQDENMQFDVIVDEAPAGPNHKQQTFAVIQAMLPILRDAEISADVWVELLRYSPLPESLVEKIGEQILAEAEPGPEEQQAAQLAQIMQQLQLGGMAADVAAKQAEISKTQADTNKTNVEAESALIEAINLARNPDSKPQSNL